MVAVKVSLWNPVVKHGLIATVVSTSLEKSFPDFGMLSSECIRDN